MNIKHLIMRLFRIETDLKQVLKNYGAKMGEGVFIGDGCKFDYDYAFLLEIGDGAVIASNTIVELHDSSLPNVAGKGKLRVGRIIIENRAYIGVNCTILPGIKIGKGSIIGAASLVNKSIPEGEVWAGTPVRYICKVSELVEKRRNNDNKLVFDIDFIGEIEKLSIDYQKYKRTTIKEVKKHFDII